MYKTAKDRSILSKLNQAVNIKRHLSKTVDPKYRDLMNAVEALDDGIRKKLKNQGGTSFRRKIIVAESQFKKDNYLACGNSILECLFIVSSIREDLYKINAKLAGTLNEFAASKLSDSEKNQVAENFDQFKQTQSSLYYQAQLIKTAGFSDWLFGVKHDISNFKYSATSLTFWKKLFGKTSPFVKDTKNAIASLKKFQQSFEEYLDEMSYDISSGSVEDCFIRSAKIVKTVESFIESCTKYINESYEPFLKQLQLTDDALASPADKKAKKELQEAKDLAEKEKSKITDDFGKALSDANKGKPSDETLTLEDPDLALDKRRENQKRLNQQYAKEIQDRENARLENQRKENKKDIESALKQLEGDRSSLLPDPIPLVQPGTAEQTEQIKAQNQAEANIRYEAEKKAREKAMLEQQERAKNKELLDMALERRDKDGHGGSGPLEIKAGINYKEILDNLKTEEVTDFKSIFSKFIK